MTKRIGDYVEVISEYSDEEKHEAALTFLKEKGKKNPVPYGDGCIVVHHGGLYYFINTITYSWCNRSQAHIKWKKANSIEEVWKGMVRNSAGYQHFKKLKEEQKA